MQTNTLKIFTKETCERLNGMDTAERKAKLAGLLTAYFQNRLPMASTLSSEIAKMAGVDDELTQKVLSAARGKGMTSPSDAPDVMNRAGIATGGVFFSGVLDPATSFGFEELFTLVDMRAAGQTSFDIVDVSNTITFNEVKSGERMKSYGVGTSKSTVTKMTVAAALGILDDWLKYSLFWNLNQAAVEARSKYYSKQATDHYALIAAITSDQNQAFSTDDVTTINNACAKILSDLDGKGYTLTGNEMFELRAHVDLKQRIEKAFTVTFNSPNADKNQLVHTIRRAYTTKIANTSYYVCLPNRKMMRGVWMDLTAEADRDILLRGSDIAYTGEYNAGIGEEDQIRRCSLS